MYRYLSKKTFSKVNPYQSTAFNQLKVGSQTFNYYDINKLNAPISNKNWNNRFNLDKLPFSIRVLLESALRNCDEFSVKKSDVEKILNWKQTQNQDVEIPFKPARVLLQDFT